MDMTGIKIAVETPGIVFAEDNGFVAGSPILDIYSQGDTEKEAIEMAKDAILSILAHWAERGSLHEMLLARGLVVRKKGNVERWVAPSRSILVHEDLIKWGYTTFKAISLKIELVAPAVLAS